MQDKKIIVENKDLDVEKIYEELHIMYPKIINIKAPVILSKNIHKEIAKIRDLSDSGAYRWFRWYIKKANYYNHHMEGAQRYNIKGEKDGFVTKSEIDSRNQYLKNRILKNP